MDKSHEKPHIPFLVCYCGALGFGNHLTILWFAPLIAFVVSAVYRKFHSSLAYRRDSDCILSAGTSINLYLPIRSKRGPLLDWSAPHTIPGFDRHLTAWQYRVWMFKGDWAVFFHKLLGYLAAVPGDIGWALGAAGFARSWNCVRAQVWIDSLRLRCLAHRKSYNVNYDIPTFRLLSRILCALFSSLRLMDFIGPLERMFRMISDARIRTSFANCARVHSAGLKPRRGRR